MDLPEIGGTLVVSGAAVWGVLKWSLGRNLKALEDRLTALETEKSVRESERLTEVREKTEAKNATENIGRELATLKGAFEQASRSAEISRSEASKAQRENETQKEHRYREYVGQVFGPLDLRVAQLEKKKR